MDNRLFIDSCFRKPVPRTPVWMMRQAGRYLPEYRAVRARADFLTLCRTPALAAEVTLQPVDILGVDAAIIFSDILVVPEAMGMELVIEEGQGGPRFPHPLRSASDIGRLSIPGAADRLGYVMDAIRTAKRELRGRVPLIGFSGSPWTLAAYMVEGHGSKNFRFPKELICNNPALAHELLEKTARVVARYLAAQIDAGADAVQIFDTWGGLLTPPAFREFSLRYIETIVREIRRPGIPVIVFCKDCAHHLPEIAQTGCDVVGLDWTFGLGEARQLAAGKVALQGNMDPTILYARPERIREEVRSLLAAYGPHPGHIFNLGHGILPDIPVDHARAFIEAVKEESPAFHTPA
ncbi:MAG TPA: uroporphyrinogen decarboxylase [Bacteroidota bacterium]|nr:uroporphyrinogen decarboxylase [Bacteroidota bacterium]